MERAAVHMSCESMATRWRTELDLAHLHRGVAGASSVKTSISHVRIGDLVPGTDQSTASFVHWVRRIMEDHTVVLLRRLEVALVLVDGVVVDDEVVES